MNHLGTLIAMSTYMGIAESTNRTHVTRPAMFIREACQPGNLSPIFSIQGRRSDFLSFLSEIGNPKYVHENSAGVQDRVKHAASTSTSHLMGTTQLFWRLV
uniref:Uncharacterized protein n=1 Tax=Arundo donax TaxID=35708 RepID=A0A0A9BLE2_ARUDO